MNKKLPSAIFGVGIACVAAYLDVNDLTSWPLWIIVFVSSISVFDL